MIALVGHQRPCGCITHAVVIDATDSPSRVRALRAELRRQGLRVQERTVERAGVVASCEHGPRKPKT